MRPFLRNFIIFGAVSFVLQFVWESVQSPVFYGGMPSVGILLYATAGDVLMAEGLYLLLGLVNQWGNWMMRALAGQDWVIMVLYGLVLSFYGETRGLWTHRWHYSAAMPLIPGTSVGVVPVVPLPILGPVAFLMSRWLLTRWGVTDGTEGVHFS